MEYRYVVHSFKAIVGIGLTLFFLVIALILFYLGRFFSGLIFSALGLVYAAVAATAGGIVTVDQEGVRLEVLRRTMRRFSWDQIREVGVMGTRVFNKNDPDKTGTVFLYFSPEELDEEKRFDMMLKWPPRNQIFFEFSLDKLAKVQNFWNKEIARTNIGSIPL